jgi:hypothetical protein
LPRASAISQHSSATIVPFAVAAYIVGVLVHGVDLVRENPLGRAFSARIRPIDVAGFVVAEASVPVSERC